MHSIAFNMNTGNMCNGIAPLPDPDIDGAACKKHVKRVRKILRRVMDPFMLPDREFIKKFRLTKPVARELMVDLRPYVYDGGHGNGLRFETKVRPDLNCTVINKYLVSTSFTCKIHVIHVPRCLLRFTFMHMAPTSNKLEKALFTALVEAQLGSV